MSQRRRSTWFDSPSGLLVLVETVRNPWLAAASEDEQRTAGRLLWNEAHPDVRTWALSVSRRLRNEPDTARLLLGIRVLMEEARRLREDQ